MNRENHDNIKYFVGSEVEHTPAFSKKTLFVVGKQPVSEIVDTARQHKVPHIFMGANRSFFVDSTDNTTFYWDKTITELLDKGFIVTLDYEAHAHEQVLNLLNKGIWQCRNFIPLLSVRIPNVQTSSPNLTIKIDDVDFKATNPGVWCIHHHEITDNNRFTGWHEYDSDVILDYSTEFHESTSAIADSVATNRVELVPTSVRQETEFTNDSGDLENKNDSTIGLDFDNKKTVVEKIINNPTAQDAAELYATIGNDTDKEPVKTKAKAKK